MVTDAKAGERRRRKMIQLQNLLNQYDAVSGRCPTHMPACFPSRMRLRLHGLRSETSRKQKTIDFRASESAWTGVDSRQASGSTGAPHKRRSATIRTCVQG